MICFPRARGLHPAFHNVTFADVQRYHDNRGLITHATPDDVVLSASIPALIHKLPSYEDRRTIMSTDAFASVDGWCAVVLHNLIWVIVNNDVFMEQFNQQFGHSKLVVV